MASCPRAPFEGALECLGDVLAGEGDGVGIGDCELPDSRLERYLSQRRLALRVRTGVEG